MGGFTVIIGLVSVQLELSLATIYYHKRPHEAIKDYTRTGLIGTNRGLNGGLNGDLNRGLSGGGNYAH